MRLFARGLAGVVLLLTLAAGPARAGILYAVRDDTRTLVSIDPVTLVETTVGSLGVATGDFGDLAYDRTTGTMYWVAGRGNNNLYTINLSTGAATLVGSHGINDEFTLGFNGTDLYGQSTDGNVYRIDKNTGAATLLGSNGVYPGGYTYDTNTGQMILLEAGGGALYSINLTNGAATLVGAGDGFVNDNDIAFDADRNLFWAADYDGNLFQFSSTFNRSTVGGGYGPIASLEYVGATAVVPEPASLAMVGISLAALGSYVRRKRKSAGE